MTTLTATVQTDDIEDTDTRYSYDGEATVRICNDAAENGYEQEPDALTWLNSARITTDPKDDAVHCLVSVGDPRGAFCFTVRRMPDGKIIINTPYPGEGMAHQETKELNPGTLVVIERYDGEPIDFTDEVEEEPADAC